MRLFLLLLLLCTPLTAAEINYQPYKSAIQEVLGGETVPIVVTDLAGYAKTVKWLETWAHPSATPALIVLERSGARLAAHFGKGYSEPYLCYLTRVRGYEGRADRIHCYSYAAIGPKLNTERAERMRVHAAKRHVSWTGNDKVTTYPCNCRTGLFRRTVINLPVRGYHNERLAQLAKNCHSQCDEQGCTKLASMKQGKPYKGVSVTGVTDLLLPGDPVATDNDS